MRKGMEGTVSVSIISGFSPCNCSQISQMLVQMTVDTQVSTESCYGQAESWWNCKWQVSLKMMWSSALQMLTQWKLSIKTTHWVQQNGLNREVISHVRSHFGRNKTDLNGEVALISRWSLGEVLLYTRYTGHKCYRFLHYRLPWQGWEGLDIHVHSESKNQTISCTFCTGNNLLIIGFVLFWWKGGNLSFWKGIVFTCK